MKSQMRKSRILLLAFSFIIAETIALSVPAPRALAQAATSADQAPAPAAGADKAAAPRAENKQETKSSESGDDAFLRSPMVQKFAKLVHLDLNQAGWLFEIINFAILFFAIAYPLTRMLPKILRKRSELLQSELETARKMTAAADSRLKSVEVKLSMLDQEVAAMRQQVEEESKLDEARIKASIVEETARLVSAAEQEIAAAAVQARRGLQRFAADLAIEQATVQLKLTPETDKALIDEFIASAGGAHGGKN